MAESEPKDRVIEKEDVREWDRDKSRKDVNRNEKDQYRESRDSYYKDRDNRDNRDNRDSRWNRGNSSRDYRDNREGRDYRDNRDNRSYNRDRGGRDRDNRDNREYGREYNRDNRGFRDRGHGQGGHNSGDNRDDKFWEDALDLSHFLLVDTDNNLVPLSGKAGCTRTCNPRCEATRARYIDKLRDHYNEMCHSKLKISPPKESFNRWLMERMILGAVCDKEWLLPRKVEPVISPSMFRELSENIPCAKFKPYRNTTDIWNNIQSYTFSALLLVEDLEKAISRKRKSREPSTEDLSMVQETQESEDLSQILAAKKEINEFVDWIKQEEHSSKKTEANLLEQRTRMRERCDPLLQGLMKGTVEIMCEEMVLLADQLANTLSNEITEMESLPPVKVLVRPHRSLNGVYEISVKGDKGEDIDETLPVNRTHYEKLKQLFTIHCSRSEEFDASVWCLLRRYKSFFGFDRFEGHGLQAALPPSAFKVLNEEFGVCFESFGSPLNCYFTRFCSAFPDTDSPFGSCGSFYNLNAKAGSFEANPPFTEELMELMVQRMEQLLEAAGDNPLSFAVFIPEWIDPPTPALVKMRDHCKFKTFDFVVGQQNHKYVSGGQHNAAPHQRLFSAVHGTHIFFLQNEAGRLKWDPRAPGRIEKLELAMKG